MMIITSYRLFTKPSLRLALVCLLAMQSATFGQEPKPRPPQQQQQQQDDAADDVLRINTSLVQTDVTVVDRKGQFVGDVGREEFELKVDGKPQPILFFERVTAGSASEAARIAAARGETIDGRTAATAPAIGRGRSVVFFVDDLHLTPEGISRVRELMSNFIEREMTQGMEALVASASGQIGFLQQFTNDRVVLRAAVARLKYVSQAALDIERPMISEYQAIAVERGDRSMLDYLIQQLIFENSPITYPRVQAENLIKSRARRIRRQAALLSGASISALESVIRARGSAAAGRQTLFYISGGFALDNGEADIFHKLQRVTDAAARTGTTVYTLDARGLAVGMQDASSAGVPDLAVSSRGENAAASAYAGYNSTVELSATQDVLRGLAADTGGRALLNTNALEAAVAKTLNETANYYLLAWRPDGLEAKDGPPKFHKIQISIKGRPELTVRVRRGFFNALPARVAGPTTAPAPSTPTSSTSATTTKAALNNALNTPNPRRALPVDAYAVFTNDAQAGSVINASVQLANDRLGFAPAAVGGKQQAQVEVVYALLDDKGKVVRSDGRTLTLNGSDAGGAAAGGAMRGKLVTNFSVPVSSAPGLYQFRTAARDANSGLVGSAFAWIEVPDLKTNRLALSSLLVTERRRANAQATGTAAAAATQPPDILRADRRFTRMSRALLQLYIYNAARTATGEAPDVELEIKILQDKKIVLSAPPHKVSVANAKDPARILYVAEVPLGNMTPGVYLLQVIVTDRVKRTTIAREIDFAVE